MRITAEMVSEWTQGPEDLEGGNPREDKSTVNPAERNATIRKNNWSGTLKD
jgi:hypothetical protein